MYEDDPDREERLEDKLRAIAEEVSRSVERFANVDLDDIVEALGVDAARARKFAEEAGMWLREQAEHLGDQGFGTPPAPSAANRPARGTEPASTHEQERALRGAAPHPLDVPTEEQGLALAALDSGRWSIESGSGALTPHGEGPGPSDALGLARELRAHDWIDEDGRVTIVGRHALGRWLEASRG
jgi:hypothetical protein